jgi:hypothetical protein
MADCPLDMRRFDLQDGQKNQKHAEMNRLEQIVRETTRYGRPLISPHQYLGMLENMLLLKKFETDQLQLFIVGLPRSGTTLIYQYIVHRLKVAYFTNGVGPYFLSPCLITFWQYLLHGEYQSDFKSIYGKVNAPLAPREAGGFWGRFFGFEQYVLYKDVSPRDIQTLRNTIACIQKLFGDAPYVNKNVKHMLRFDALSKIFPNAVFLLVERDLQNVALSVLRGRYKNLSDPRQWWSVKPPNYLNLKDLPVVEQVAYQLISLQKKMEVDLSMISPERTLRVAYEQFCHNPENLTKTLINVLGPIGFRNPAERSFLPAANEPQTSEEKHLVDFIKYATSK